MKLSLRLLVCCGAALCLLLTARAETPDTNSIPDPPLAAMPGPRTNNGPPARPETIVPDATNRPALAGTNVPTAAATNGVADTANWELKLALAKEQHLQQSFGDAVKVLEEILKTNAPVELQRAALYEMGLVMEDSEQTTKAQQVWSQYLHVYPEDPTIPEILLRQGLLFRKMGADALAISKFYAVMSSALKLKEDNMNRYRQLVVQAQTEIATTYFLDAQFESAADYFNRILKSGEAETNRMQLEAQLIRSLSYLTNHAETIGKAQSYLTRFPKSPDVPEVRFLLASALKSTGRNSDSMQQVLLLLQSQQENVRRDPETWAYWQRRAGNEIANQIYKEGDYPDALQIYVSLADLDKSPVWRVPVWYQTGLIYEQLQQWSKASDTYTRILDCQKEINSTNQTPALISLVDMAKWRKDYIAWMQKAKISDLALRTGEATNSPGAPDTSTNSPARPAQ